MTRRLGSARRRNRRGSLLPVHPRTRRLLRLVLFTGLGTIGILIPVESARLPTPLDDLTGTQPALAQTPVIRDGFPGSCPSTPVQWYVSASGSECELSMQPCPVDPVVGNLALRYSVNYDNTDGLTLVEYPVMCELRILEVNDPVVYGECLNQTGFVKMVVDVVVGGGLQTERLCRLLQPAECPAGVQFEPDICRAIERRPWTCPANYKPKNEYNKCYQLIARSLGTSHPACLDGAPRFVAQRCSDYVGDDFVELPGLVDCTTAFPTASPPNLATALSTISPAQSSSDYWCEFNTMFLKAACHGANPPATECAQSMAMCLKRASETGGCSAIAHTIRCRALQHAFGADTLTVPQVRNQGCEPCVILPFSPVPPNCPTDLSMKPRTTTNRAMSNLLRLREDFNVGNSHCGVDDSGNISAACRTLPVCADPPSGALAWSSSHFSQYAVVNSPVILNLVDVPADERAGHLSITSRGLRGNITFAYPSSPAMGIGDVIATYARLDSNDGSTVTVNGMVDTYGECMYTRTPLFELTIRQLWPDDPADGAEIERLFGLAALDWWNALTTTAEQQQAIEARGLDYWPSLLGAERAVRAEELTQQVPCDYGDNYRPPIWCRWTPTDTGLFRITAGAAWIGNRWDNGSRRSISTSEANRINNTLRSSAVRDALAAQLAAANATPDVIGLNSTLTAVLPTTGFDADFETMFSGVRTERACGGSDVRIRCDSSTVGFGNYTESHPIGIAVHEVRVATRAPGS